MILTLNQESTLRVTEEAKRAKLKLQNQRAHLESLLRKKQALDIEINRLKKTINLNSKRTRKSILKELSVEDPNQPLNEAQASQLREKTPELYQLLLEMDKAEIELRSLLEFFQEEE